MSFLFVIAYAEQGQGADVAGAVVYGTGIDEETRLLLQDQHVLIDRQYLQMGDILGSGKAANNASTWSFL